VLTALDEAVGRLNPSVLATVLLAEVRRGPQVDDGVRMCWSNAGHPPPVVVRGGVAEILEQARPDPLLGLRLAVSRQDHELSLAAGDVVVMFTDGLVEERGEVIDEGLEWVRQTVEGAADRPAAEVCDVLMSRLADTRGDDDTALLVVRAREVARDARRGEALQAPVGDPAKAVSG
jgi:Stage II sporulation protein E (SpoIIE)